MRILKVEVKRHQPYTEDVIEIEGEFGLYVVTGTQLEEFLINDQQMCEDCGDSGEISTDVDDGEGHTMRGVGTQKCHCKTDKDDHDPDRDV